jgi:ABC-type uncharacterized transport system substrate-binding protein
MQKIRVVFKKFRLFSVVVLFCAGLLYPEFRAGVATPYEGKKILVINSYHKGYLWSDGEMEELESILKKTPVTYEVVYMDTKYHPSEEEGRAAAEKVKKRIEEFKPDVIISLDDPAFKYVIKAYYRDADIPVVFCGINWDISVYGAPYTNTTGMLEIGMGEMIFQHLKKYAAGPRAGFLGTDMLSERKNAEYFGRFVKGGFTRVELVLDFEAWKRSYLSLIESVDMLFIAAPEGIKGWNLKEAQQFILDHIRIPIGTESDRNIPLALLGISQVPEEQGEYAAWAALEILKGVKPSQIPIAKNKKGNLYLNLKIAEKLGVVFTPSMLRNAKIIYGMEEKAK